jgi:hypothetical protein
MLHVHILKNWESESRRGTRNSDWFEKKELMYMKIKLKLGGTKKIIITCAFYIGTIS